MEQPPYQIVIIGGGPGGYVAALRAAQQGARVAVIEKHHLGGTCLNYGCIPSKALLASAELAHHARHAADWGLKISGVEVDWPAIQGRKDRIIGGLRGGIAGLLKARKVDSIAGTATIEGPGRVAIAQADGTTRTINGQHLIIATGSAPTRIAAWSGDIGKICTSDEAVHWQTLPRSLIIVGGGVIGCEFACIMHGLGVQVTLIEAAPQLLATPGLDRELGKELAKVFAKRGITVHCGVALSAVSTDGTTVTATAGEGKTFTAERLLVAVGRRPNSAGLGLDRLGVATSERGFITVDDQLATSVRDTWAIGDVNGRCLLAHAASSQAVTAVDNVLARLAGKPAHAAAAVIPSAVYTFPEIGAVGLTEQEAQQQGLPYAVGRFPLAHLGKALAAGAPEGFVKVIRHRESDALLGVHAIGHHATEIIATAATLLHTTAKVHDIAHMVFAHPTISEAVKEAAEDALGEGLHLQPRKRLLVTAA